MIARSTPIGVKLKPDPPEDDAEQLRKLVAKERRLIAGLVRTHADIVRLEQKMGIATEQIPRTA